jgi:hypothetical protein
MALDVNVVMVGAAPSLSHAITAVLSRLGAIGFRLQGPLRDVGPEDRKIPFQGDWAAAIRPWTGASFSVARKGPLISVTLEKIDGALIRAQVTISGRMLQRYFAEGRKHDPEFYAPLFQIALALGARAGVGEFDLEEFEPRTDKEVERAIKSSPMESSETSSLGFLRRDPGTLKPGGAFTVTERPEGYWLLEDPDYLDILAM